MFVYFPTVLFIIFKSLCFILLFIKPRFNSILSVNESLGPLTAGSLSGVLIDLDKSFFASDAYICLFLYIVIT